MAELPPTNTWATKTKPKGLLDCDRLLQLKQIFMKYDSWGSNELDIEQLGLVLQEFGMPVSADGMHMFFDNFGGPDVRITFSEFMAAFHSPKPGYDPPLVDPIAAADGKFVDVQFPPQDSSIWPVAAGPTREAGPAEWVRSSNIGGELFEAVHPNDLARDRLGDCWLLSALAGLAEFEGAIFGLFEERRQSPDGRYTMRIFNGKYFEPIVIDDFVPISPSSGEPLFALPRNAAQWVLLVEKAVAKWMGGYLQCTGAYCLVGYMLLTDAGPCIAYGQGRGGQPPFDSESYTELRVDMADPHKRSSVRLAMQGAKSADEVWQALRSADEMNYIMCGWTLRSSTPQAPTGSVDSNGIVKDRAYTIISVREVNADGRIWRVVQLRNIWNALPGAKWNGPLSNVWPQWGQSPQLEQELGISNPALNGMFWMTWDDFRCTFTDIGIVPKTMEVPRLGQVELQLPIQAGDRHGRIR